MVDLVCYLTNLLFLDIFFLCYHINLNSSIILCLSSGDIYLSLVFIILIFNCLWIILLWIFWDFWNFISDSITNQFTSCFYCFLSYCFWRSFKCICIRFISTINKFLAIFTTCVFTYIFTNIFAYIFSKR